jgi:hypothetical protein
LNKRRSARIEQRKNLCELIRHAHFRRTGCPGVPAVSWCDKPPPLLLLEAVAQFNRGDYFEQHETLELLWRAEARPVRRLYQGILQIDVAFHHLRRRNYHGVMYMLTRGADRDP